MVDGTVPGWLGSDPHCVRLYERNMRNTGSVESNRSAGCGLLAVCAHRTDQWQRTVL